MSNHGQQYGYPPQSSAPPPQVRKSSGIRVNGHGFLGVLAIALMVFVAFNENWNIDWLYFVLATAIYATAIIGLSIAREQTSDDDELFDYLRWLLGAHLAFFFLVGGLWVNPNGFFVQAAVFLAAVGLGLAIPFMLLRKTKDQSV